MSRATARTPSRGPALPAVAAALLLGLLPVGVAARPAPPADEPSLAVTTVSLGDGAARLALRQLDADPALELLRIDADGVAVRQLRPDGTYPEQDDARLAWPGDELGWDLVDFDGDGDEELVLLVAGEQVVVHDLGPDGPDAGTTLVTDARGVLPRGIRRMPFVRDVDGDGADDLVIPGAGVYRIFLRDGQGAFGTPVEVAFEAQASYAVGDPTALDTRFSEEITVPWFRLEDVDGDGTTDLISETEDVVLFHLARPELSRQPSWRLPIGELREAARSGWTLDLDDLFGNLDVRVTWRLADLDGVPPNDLILQQGGTFQVFLGGSTGDLDRPPDQVLKASGNVLHYLVRDVLGDPLPELQIIRGDKVSLGQVIRWLVLPGALDFDVFTYRNERGTFARKPTRRSRVRLAIPRLLAFLEDLESMQDELKERFDTPARRCCLDGDGRLDDVVDLRDGRVQFFRDVLPEELPRTLSEQLVAMARQGTDLDELLEAYILDDLDAMEDGAEREIDLADLKTLQPVPWAAYRQRTDGHAPVASLLTPATDDAALRVTDVDGDGTSDVIVTGKTADAVRLAQILVVRPGR